MTIHLGSFLAGVAVGVIGTLVFAVICGLALNVAAHRGPRPCPERLRRSPPKPPPPPPPRKDTLAQAAAELARIQRSVERGEWE